MSQDAREQARHISEITKAYDEGKTIISKGKGSLARNWYEMGPNDDWDFVNRIYEVKPEERKHEKLAELLKRIGWKDTGDNQWENLEKAMTGIRWLLSQDDQERKAREWTVWLNEKGDIVTSNPLMIAFRGGPFTQARVVEVLPSENTGGEGL